MTTRCQLLLFAVLFLALVPKLFAGTLPILYARTICAGTGGSTSLECDVRLDYAIYDVTIGRSFVGACDWDDTTLLDCTVPRSQSTELMTQVNKVYQRARDCSLDGSTSCDITLEAVTTECGNDAAPLIRIRYFCFDASLISDNGGEIKRIAGCGDITQDDLFGCQESFNNLNILFAEFNYLAINCSDRSSVRCNLDANSGVDWLYLQEDCSDQQSCDFNSLAPSSNADLYGCTGFRLQDVTDTSYAYDYICQHPGMFAFPDDSRLPVVDTCVGMSDGLHAVVFYGTFEENVCWQRYTDCLNENIQTMEACPMGEGFDERTRQCHSLASRECSVAVPEISAESLSATEINVSWTVDDDPTRFILTIDDPEYSTSTDLSNIAPDVFSFVFSSLVPNTEYTFSVTAEKGTFRSSPDNVTQVTYPENPTGSASDVMMTSAVINYDFEETASFVIIEVGGQKYTIAPEANGNLRFINVTNLSGGVRYSASIYLEGMTGLLSQEPFNFTFLTVPNPPENLAANQFTETSIEFTWDQPGASDNWMVYRDNQVDEAASTTDQEYNLQNLEPGFRYEFFVYNMVEDERSTEISLTESTIPHPVDFTSVSADHESVDFSWQHNVGRSDSFLVTCFDSAGAVVQDFPTDQLDASISDLNCGSNYSLQIIVQSYDKTSSATNITFTTRPVAPADLQVADFTTSTIDLSWSLSECADEYYVYQTSDKRNDNRDYTVNGTNQEVKYENLIPGDTYNYLVRSAVTDHDGNILLSLDTPIAANVTQTLIPLPPSDVLIESYTSNSLVATWNQPTGGIYTGFYVSTNDASRQEVDEFELEETGLVPGAMQVLEIMSFSEGSDSSQNSSVVTVSQRLKPNPPRNFIVENRGNNNTEVSFLPPSEGQYTSFSFEAVSSDGTVLVNKTILASDETKFIKTLSTSIFGDQINVKIYTFSVDERSETALESVVNLHPADPVGFTVTGFSETDLSVSWELPQGLVGGYNLILTKLDGSSPELTQRIEDENTLESSFADLVPGSQYQLELCVYSLFDESLSSLQCDVIQQLLMPVPPNSLVVIPLDKNSVNFTWSMAIDEGSFDGFDVFSSSGFVSPTQTTFTQIGGLIPGTDYTFSVLTYVANATNVIRSENQSEIGWPYPDDIVFETFKPVSSQDGSVEVNLDWTLPEGGHSSFVFNLTSIPYADGVEPATESLQFTTQSLTRRFSETISQNNVAWFVPGMHVSYSAVAVYRDLQSQQIATGDFYIPPLTPTLRYVDGSRTTNSVNLTWSFVEFENALSELFILQLAHFSETDQFQNNLREVSTVKFAELVNSLMPGQKYDFRIRSSVNESLVVSDWSNIVTEATFPLPPINLQIEDLVVTWSPPEGIVESYTVKISDSEGSELPEQTIVSSENLELDINNSNVYTPGRAYTFEIYSVSNDLASSNSSTIEYTFVPSNVDFTSVSVLSTTSCELIWGVPTGDVDGYVLTVTPLTSSDTYTEKTFNITRLTTHVVNNLTQGAEYRFEIVARSGGKLSVVPGVLTAQKSPELESIAIPDKDTQSVVCSWTPTGVVTSYKVSILDINGNVIEERQVDLPVDEQQFTGLEAGQFYSCRVIAISGTLESAPLTADFTLYPVVPQVSIAYFGTTDLTANWSMQSGLYDGFVVALDGCRDSLLMAPASMITLERTWDGLTPGSVCRVRVWSLSNEVQSESFGVASHRLYPATPLFGQFSATETTVVLVWTQQGTASSYSLRVNSSSGQPQVESLVGSDRSFTIVGLSSSEEYMVTLDAFSSNLKNLESATAIVNTSPSPVVNPIIIPVSDTELNITWIYVSPSSRIRFVITRLPTSNETGVSDPGESTQIAATGFSDSGLQPGTDYTYEVVVSYTGIESEPATATGYTYPAVPFNILTEDLANDHATLLWSVQPNYESFRVNVEGDDDNYEIENLEIDEMVLFLDNLVPGNQYSVTVESKYKDLYSQGLASFSFETDCYPIRDETAKPWKIAFWLTFVYSVIITTICLYLAYLVYKGVPPRAEVVKPARRYLISATPLDGTKWQRKYGEFSIRP